MCHNQGFTKAKNRPVLVRCVTSTSSDSWPVLVTSPTSTGSFCPLGKTDIIGRIHRSLCPWAIRLHHDSSSWMKLKKSIYKQLLVRMRMTIGMGVKPLFVSYANHYSFVHRTTIGLSANDYCTEPFSQQLHAPAYEAITLSAALKRGSSSETTHWTSATYI